MGELFDESILNGRSDGYDREAAIITFLRHRFVVSASVIAMLTVHPTTTLAAHVTEVLVRRMPGIARITQEPSGIDITPSYVMSFREDASACLVGAWDYKPSALSVGTSTAFGRLSKAVNDLGILRLPNSYPKDGIVFDADMIAVWIVADGHTYGLDGPLNDKSEPPQLKKFLLLIDRVASSTTWTTTDAPCLSKYESDIVKDPWHPPDPPGY